MPNIEQEGVEKLEQSLQKLDAAYISKIILGRLGVPYDAQSEEKLFRPKSKALSKAIKDIQNIEGSWKYSPADQSHTFGRKELNEVIQLWSVPEKSAEVMENLVVLTGAKNVVEVGTSAGFSTLFLANGAAANGGHVTTMELLDEKIKLAKANFQKAGLEKDITLLEDEASKVLGDWKGGEIDFVFLDADKENYGKYLDLLLPKMKMGGLIVADNINDYGHMMEDCLQRVTGSHFAKSRVDLRVRSYYYAALDNGLMITKKIAD